MSVAEAAKFSAQRGSRHPISHYDTSLRPLSFGRHLQLRLLAGLGLAATRTIGPTLRFEVLGWQQIERVHASGRRCVYSFWHRTIFLAMWWWRNRGVVAMTSANFDGQVLSRALRGLGYGTTHGSSSRGGLRGLAELAKEMERGHDGTFSADGPRGPRYVAKVGPALLARRTGCPIICVHLRAQYAHTFEKSWDHFQLPHPFSRAVLVVAPPIEVPPGADREALDRKHAELQARLERVRDVAESWFTLSPAEQERQRALWNA
jgi:lysophospholipid acyltransferase (LPLAT)-like uncharacterized protein